MSNEIYAKNKILKYRPMSFWAFWQEMVNNFRQSVDAILEDVYVTYPFKACNCLQADQKAAFAWLVISAEGFPKVFKMYVLSEYHKISYIFIPSSTHFAPFIKKNLNV